MADEKRYCEDCKLYVAASDPRVAECKKPRPSDPVQLVTRAAAPQPRFCASERGHEGDDSCGAAAKWFEPKQ